MEKKLVRLNKRQKNNNSNINILLEKENEKKISNLNLNKYENNSNNNQKNQINNIMDYDNKEKDYLSLFNKQNFEINIDKEINNTDLGANEFIRPFINSDKTSKTDSNYISNNINSKNLTLMNFLEKKISGNNLNRSVNKVSLTNNRSAFLPDKNTNFNIDDFNQKNLNKINIPKDEYIDFFQKQIDDNNKNNIKFDSNNKELLKKCNDLIYDNKLLNKALSERTNKFNLIIKENLNIKSELDKSILNNQKNEQKIIFYEEQLNLFKNNNDNYQKIIKELKMQNEQLNTKLNKIKTTNEENKKKSEEKYKNEIEEIKKNMQESFNTKMKIDDKYYENKIKNLTEEINKLKESNKELRKQLDSKERVIELMYKDNEKLINQNKLNNIQIEQNSKQIKDLKTIIQQKESLIKNLKSKEIETEKMFFNKSSSSVMRFENSEFISENLTKLMNDNEENRMKIEYLNDKLKTIDEIEKKYTQLVKDNKNLSLSEKNSSNLQSTEITPREKRYNNKNHNFYSSTNTNILKTNLDSKESEIKKLKNNLSPKKNISTDNIVKKTYIAGNSVPPKNVNMYKSNLSRNEIRNKRNTREIREIKVIKENKENKEIKEIKENKENKNKSEIKTLNKRDLYQKNKRVLSIKNEIMKDDKEKEDKNNEKENKGKLFKGRNFYKKGGIKSNEININVQNDKKEPNEEHLEVEKDEGNNDIYKNNLKKKLSFSNEEIMSNEDNNEQLNNNINEKEIEKENKSNITYYLYGIDRNDFLHVFDIKNKIWDDKKNILELEDKSDTFKKDYQYDGTLLYNTLEGIYILTGENTDILYYFNSKTNMITKICKFNNSHNNGSIMFDENSNCLYVFGGKKISSCEYYSFKDRKVYNLPDLITDRANASFIISNNKIFGFFGFSYEKDDYANTIEYIDYNKKDKWVELTDITFLKNNILFDIESTSTMYYKQNTNQILIYSGIQGNDEDFVTDYYLVYDVKNNTMDKINNWDLKQYKFKGKKWRDYEIKNSDQKGFHFAKNTRFLLIPKNCTPEGYNENDLIDVMIDYKNNVHFINQEEQKIDIYRGSM